MDPTRVMLSAVGVFRPLCRAGILAVLLLSALSPLPRALAADAEAPKPGDTTPASGSTAAETTTATSVAPPAASDQPAAKPAEAAAANPVIKDFKLTGETWTCEADGKPVSGILVRPPGDGPFPAIVLSHGHGSSAEKFAIPIAREFVKWGFVCIGPDYTHGEARGDWKQFGASPENIRRAKACLAILRSQPYVDSKRLFACGHSMGAWLTTGLAAEAGGQLKAVAIYAGGVVETANRPAEPTRAVAERIRTPMLIVHGSRDTTVPPEHSALLKAILDAKGVPNERRVIEGAGHGIARRPDVHQLTRDWFRKHAAAADVERASPAATSTAPTTTPAATPAAERPPVIPDPAMPGVAPVPPPSGPAQM